MAADEADDYTGMNILTTVPIFPTKVCGVSLARTEVNSLVPEQLYISRCHGEDELSVPLVSECLGHIWRTLTDDGGGHLWTPLPESVGTRGPARAVGGAGTASTVGDRPR
ncbi:hypothetical protein HPB47_000706 [Ixodes persulcatus]|uniref:Uncharacterized protein n=1 Tax=Ixodes persulcatus TaxID=34615 RepID=A0AC60PSK7_IXOPE|nr:hypothetical protein HPB47_000706 [Ixodes persulcatus]